MTARDLDALGAMLTRHLTGEQVRSADSDRAALRTRRDELRGRLGRQLGEWLHLLPALELLPGLIGDVEGLRDGHRERERAKLELEAVETLADEIATDSGLRRAIGADGHRVVRNRLDHAVQARRGQLDRARGQRPVSPLNGFADAELAEVQAGAQAALGRELHDPVSTALDLRRVEARLAELDDQAVAGGAAAEDQLRRRDELAVELGRTEQRAEQLADRLVEHDTTLASLRTQVARLEQRLSAEDDTEWLAAADSVCAALEEFVVTARSSAVDGVRAGMLAGLSRLLRKTALVRDVEINPATYAVRMLGADGDEVELPSAAEHQLAAMAFIEGVLTASAAPMPLFVDTPLARLDSHHRRAVVAAFWPSLGRQVIVLSTDEEIVGGLLELARPHLAETYLVACDDHGASSIRPGAYLEAPS